MAKVITQETVDNAVAKATAAEQKRCVAVVKAVDTEGEKGAKSLLQRVVAAIKLVAE